MIGIQLKGLGKETVEKCLEKGLRINCTHESVLRMMPAMIVTKEEIDAAVDILDNVLTENGK
jgi:acetylornithine/succinyldiaminopimelate/putrescine aminotransferase